MGQVVPLRREFAQTEPWLAKKELARYFGVCSSTIDNWARNGMPYRQVGGRRRYRISSCEAWLSM